MTMAHRTIRMTTAGVLALGLAGLGAASAQAKGDDVRNAGSCSAASDWKLKAKPDDGAIEVELEVDSNVVGQTWSFTIKDDGVKVATGTRTTTGPSGSFSVERTVPDRAGADRFVATARNAATGEKCRATVTLPA